MQLSTTLFASTINSPKVERPGGPQNYGVALSVSSQLFNSFFSNSFELYVKGSKAISNGSSRAILRRTKTRETNFAANQARSCGGQCGLSLKVLAVYEDSLTVYCDERKLPNCVAIEECFKRVILHRAVKSRS